MLEHAAILSIVVYFIGALLIPLFARFGAWVPHGLALATTGLVLAISILGLGRVIESGPIHYELGGWRAPIGIELLLDPLAAFFVLMIAAVALVVLVHSRRTVPSELPGRDAFYYSGVLLLLGSFTGIVLTGDLFNLYVFLEISSLASYALLGVGTAQAALAAFRYLILGTVGASFYLLGVGLIYMATGTLNMVDLGKIVAAGGLVPLVTLGLVFILAGAAVKMALFPLHLWLPDVYSAAPSNSASLIAPLGTKVAAYIIIRVLFSLMDATTILQELPFEEVLAWLGAAGIVWGSIMAVAQRDLRRMLAYSSVAQIGYIALGIGLGNAAGFIGAVLHALNHACMKSCLFMVCGNLREAGRSLAIDQLDHSLRRRLPWTSLAFTVAALSMIGLPPTAGFFSKWYLLLGSVEQGAWIFVVVIVASSLLNAVYFFRVIERMYLRRGDADGVEAPVAYGDNRASLVAPVMFLAVALLVLGLGNVTIVRELIQPMLPGGY